MGGKEDAERKEETLRDGEQVRHVKGEVEVTGLMVTHRLIETG